MKNNFFLLEFHENNFDHQGENRVTKIFEDYYVILLHYYPDFNILMSKCMPSRIKMHEVRMHGFKMHDDKMYAVHKQEEELITPQDTFHYVGLTEGTFKDRI